MGIIDTLSSLVIQVRFFKETLSREFLELFPINRSHLCTWLIDSIWFAKKQFFCEDICDNRLCAALTQRRVRLCVEKHRAESLIKCCWKFWNNFFLKWSWTLRWLTLRGVWLRAEFGWHKICLWRLILSLRGNIQYRKKVDMHDLCNPKHIAFWFRWWSWNFLT